MYYAPSPAALPFRPLLQPLPNPYGSRYANPLPASAVVGLVVLGIVVVGGAIYFGMRSVAKGAASVTQLPPQQAALPPARPLPPLPPAASAEAQTLQFWETPVAYVELLFDADAERPYYVAFGNRIDMPYRDGEVAFETEAEAREFALGKAYPLGMALDEADSVVHHDYQNGMGGGAVWQSAAGGDFYITWNVEDSSGQEAPFATPEAAKLALHQRLRAAGITPKDAGLGTLGPRPHGVVPPKPAGAVQIP